MSIHYRPLRPPNDREFKRLAAVIEEEYHGQNAFVINEDEEGGDT